MCSVVPDIVPICDEIFQVSPDGAAVLTVQMYQVEVVGIVNRLRSCHVAMNKNKRMVVVTEEVLSNLDQRCLRLHETKETMLQVNLPRKPASTDGLVSWQ